LLVAVLYLLPQIEFTFRGHRGVAFLHEAEVDAATRVQRLIQARPAPDASLGEWALARVAGGLTLSLEQLIPASRGIVPALSFLALVDGLAALGLAEGAALLIAFGVLAIRAGEFNRFGDRLLLLLLASAAFAALGRGVRELVPALRERWPALRQQLPTFPVPRRLLAGLIFFGLVAMIAVSVTDTLRTGEELEKNPGAIGAADQEYYEAWQWLRLNGLPRDRVLGSALVARLAEVRAGLPGVEYAPGADPRATAATLLVRGPRERGLVENPEDSWVLEQTGTYGKVRIDRIRGVR
jgi:hypothetical protein